MKKLLLTLSVALTVSAGSVIAQSETAKDASIGLKMPTEKGSIMIGTNLMVGDLNFGSVNNYSTTTLYDIDVAPRAGYFVADNFLLGGNVGASFWGAVSNGDLYTHSESVSIGIFARKYFGRVAEKNGEINRLRFFVEGGVYYNTGWSTYKPTEPEPVMHETFNTLKAYVMPGLNYFVNKNVAIEAGLNYSRVLETDAQFGYSNNIHFNIGLQFFLNGKK